jgi:hypothetical protein
MNLTHGGNFGINTDLKTTKGLGESKSVFWLQSQRRSGTPQA